VAPYSWSAHAFLGPKTPSCLRLSLRWRWVCAPVLFGGRSGSAVTQYFINGSIGGVSWQLPRLGLYRTTKCKQKLCTQRDQALPWLHGTLDYMGSLARLARELRRPVPMNTADRCFSKELK
jgi:hypothetical protein